MTKKELIAKIERFRDLKEDWNGYGALPIPDKVIDKAIEIVESIEHTVNFEVSPVARESIQLEINYDNFYIEFEIYEDRVVVYSEVGNKFSFELTVKE